MATPSLSPQPLIACRDVEASSRWYQAVLGATSDHGGPEYERLVVDDVLVLQLHTDQDDHHHVPVADPDRPKGNGALIWFDTADFAGRVEAIRAFGPEIVTDVARNPNSQNLEIWLRDPDGFLVVLAERPG